MSKDNLSQLATNISNFSFLVKNYWVAPKTNRLAYYHYRVLRPLLKGYYKGFKLFHPNRPWTTPASILFFDQALTKDMVGLEYGSGNSTKYFANKLDKLVSIEHHQGWYDKVKADLEQLDITNVEYLFVAREDKLTPLDDSEETLNKYSGNEDRPEFRNYYNRVNEYPDSFFDFVLIDGRVRVKCGLNAIPKLKSGGIFVLDNSERARYAPLHLALNDWPKVETTTGLTNTTIWIKP
jgi:hypothetical protein